MSLADLIFFVAAAVTVASAGYAALSRNIVRAVFALLGTFFGVAVLYGLLRADFVAVVQVLVYVGGILVLLLFAVMLTGDIATANRSNPAGNWLWGILAAAGLLALVLPLAWTVPWIDAGPGAAEPSTAAIGERLLGPELLAFEVISVVLLGVVIGAVVLARRPREDGGEGGK